MAVCSKGMISVWDVKNLSKPFLIIKGFFVFLYQMKIKTTYIVSIFFAMTPI